MQRPVVHTARKLRREMTLPEVMLWEHLRAGQAGFKFRRQHPIGPYVIDFYCVRARLAVEVDGFAHDGAGRADRDKARDDFLYENGHDVLRLAAKDILADVENSVAAIVARVENPLHHAATRRGPPPRAGEDL